MGRSMFVIFVIVCYLLCEKLSVINGRRKHFGTVKGLATLPEQAETLNIKCTDCTYKDQTDIKIRQLPTQRITKSNQRKTHHGRRRNRGKIRRHHRNRNNLKPSHYRKPSNIMSASDPSAHHVIYPSNDQRYSPLLPEAAARLEARLHPSLTASVRKLKATLTDILQKMKRKIDEMHIERRGSQLTARDNMMKLREELQQITRENNKAYDVILDVSQLTRMVILKLGRHGIPGPQHHMQKPQWLREIRGGNHQQMTKASNTSYLVNGTYRKVMGMKINSVQQDSQMGKLNDVMKAGLSDLERLRDLKMHARRVLNELHIGIEQTVLQKKIDRYRQFENNIRKNVNESHVLATSAYRDLKYSQRTYEDNLHLKKSIERERKRRAQPSRRRRNVHVDSADYRTLVDMTYSKSRRLQKSEETLNRTILPILSKARQITHGDGALPVMLQVQKIGDRLKSYMKKIDRVLDDLRKFLGDEDVIAERCHKLIALGEFEVETSVLDCNPYCDEEGSGSGCGSGEGEEIIDPDTPPVPSVLSPLNETDSGTESISDGDSDFVFIDKDNITLKPLKPDVMTTTTVASTTKKLSWWDTLFKSKSSTPSITTTNAVQTTLPSLTMITSTEKTIETSTAMSTSTTLQPPKTTTSTTQQPPKTTTSTTQQPPKTTTSTTQQPPKTTKKSTHPPSTRETTKATTTTIHSTTPSTTTKATTTTIHSTTPSTTTKATTTTIHSTTPSTTTKAIPSTSTTTKATPSTSTTTNTPSTTVTTAPRKPTTVTAPSTTIKTTDASNLVDIAISGSGDIDDTETEIELQTTKLLPKVTTTTLSTLIEIGSGDDDLIIVDEDEKKEIPSTTPKSFIWPWGWAGDDPRAGIPNLFRDRLSEKANIFKSKAVDLFEESAKLRERVADITQKNTLLAVRREGLEVYVSNLQETSYLWNTTKVIVNDAKPRMNKISKPFLRRIEQIVNKSREFGKIATEKLAEYEGASVSSKRNEESRKTAQILTDLLSKVSDIKKSRQEMKRILTLTTDPCSKIQTSAASLRNNIADLRKKIEQAKRIASAMPASISMDGKESLSLTVTSSSLFKSPFSAFGFCLKPEKSSMAIATLYNPASSNWVVELEDSKPKITFYGTNGEKTGQMQSQTEVQLGKWIDLKISRYGSSVLLNTTDLETSRSVVEAKAISELPVVIEQPKSAIVGFAKNKENFMGCIADVTLNDEKLGLLASKLRKTPCKSNCVRASNAAAMVFDGNGFVKFSVDMIYQLYPIKEITLQYRTYQDNGILLLLNDRLQALQVLISVMDCRLHVEARINRGTTVVRSNSTQYCDGKQGFVKLEFGKDIEVKTSKADEVFLPESSTQEITPSIDDGVYLGGLGSQNKMISGKSKLRSVVGCISNLVIENKEFPFYMAEGGRNVHLGNCEHNAWFKCVRFDDKSEPIVLDKGRDAKFVSLAITRDSMGRVLNYKTKDFDVDVLVDGKGIEIVDNKEEDRYHLPSSLDHTNHWLVLSINDKDEKIILSLNGTSVEVAYSTGWFASAADLQYTVTVGASGDGSESFVGGIARLIIDDRETPLDNYRSSHHLQNCRRPLVDALDTANMSEKPVC